MDRCPICWEAMTQKNAFRIGVCQHIFHGHCFLKWLCFKDPNGPHSPFNCRPTMLTAPCPMCKRSLTFWSEHLRRYRYRYPYVKKKSANGNANGGCRRFLKGFFCCSQAVVHEEET